MIESLLAWLGSVPPVTVYGVIALLAIVENIFPPFPADSGIAIGAFLSHRGITNPWLVLVVTLLANGGGAMAIYFLASRHSASLFRSRLARRFISEHAMIKVRHEYDRFGTPGLFVVRLLPGVRAVVPPFAGLIHVGAVRVAVTVFLAGAIWYGAIVYFAAKLGANLDRVIALVGGANQIAGGVALVGVAVLLWWVVRRTRGGPA
ncbi:MAG TPA: DedA family protein [Gemmatimonadales bacterium]|nr:DedA family protein [Gemmatimonadales bacterium]